VDFGGDASWLPYDELHESAADLSSSEAAGCVGRVIPRRGLRQAVTHATQTLRCVVTGTVDEPAKERREAAKG
jgi:hypothetical protein